MLTVTAHFQISQFPNFQIISFYLYSKKMESSRTETNWFFAMLAFLIFYGFYLFVFREVLVGVENGNEFRIFKPEPVQIFIMSLLIVLYYFCFLGLYTFSKGSRWQKNVAVITGLLITGSLLYGFHQWYLAAAHPFIRLENLPWYAKEQTKFLIANIPILIFFIAVFIFRILMMFQSTNAPRQ